MRKKTFRSDFEVLGMGASTGKKEIDIHHRQIPSEISCERCMKDLLVFTEQLKTLESANQILIRMLSDDILQRPTVQDLKAIWQKWEWKEARSV